jgi:hypothetical protein
MEPAVSAESTCGCKDNRSTSIPPGPPILLAHGWPKVGRSLPTCFLANDSDRCTWYMRIASKLQKWILVYHCFSIVDVTVFPTTAVVCGSGLAEFRCIKGEVESGMVGCFFLRQQLFSYTSSLALLAKDACSRPFIDRWIGCWCFGACPIAVCDFPREHSRGGWWYAQCSH